MKRSWSLIICAWLLLAGMWVLFPGFTENETDTGFTPTEEKKLSGPGKGTRSDFAVLPTWDKGFKWRYHRTSRIEMDPEGYINLVDEADYVVTEIETVTTYNGYSALGYNLSIQNGKVSGDGYLLVDTDDDGEGDRHVDIEIDSSQSTIQGFQWYRVSDLAIMQDNRDLHIVVNTTSSGFGVGTAVLDAENSLQAAPSEEDYDFPIYTGDRWNATFTYHNDAHYQIDLPGWLNGLGVEDQENDSVTDTHVDSRYWCNRTTSLANDYDTYDGCYQIDSNLRTDNGSGKQVWWYYPPAKNFARWKIKDLYFGGLTITESNNDLKSYHVWDVSVSGVSLGPEDRGIVQPGGKLPVTCDFPSSEIWFDSDVSDTVFSTDEIGGEHMANVSVPATDDNTEMAASVPPEKYDQGSHGLIVKKPSGEYIAKTVRTRVGDLSVDENDISLSTENILAGEPVVIAVDIYNNIDTFIGMDINVGLYLDYGTPQERRLVTETIYGMKNGPSFRRPFRFNWQDPISGEHTLAVIVDYDDLVSETDEDNNIAVTGPFHINTRPKAVLNTGIEEVKTYQDVVFDATGSTDDDGDDLSFVWDFGDGDTSTEQTIVHNYTDDGKYNVTLTVMDEKGAENSSHTTIEVLNRKPLLIYELGFEGTNVGAGDEVTFDASKSRDIDGTVEKVFWKIDEADSYWKEVAKHKFQKRGSYEVTLTIEDDDGVENSTTFTLPVDNKLPVISLTVSKTAVSTFTDIDFDATGTEDLDPQGSVVSYSWDFGDGQKAEGRKVSHLYEDDGEYEVVLKVTDNEDGVAEKRIPVRVDNRKPEMKLKNVFDTGKDNLVSLDEGLTIDATGSSDRDGEVKRYYFDPGEGGGASWSAEGVFDHKYESEGKYTLTVKIEDDDGATVTKTFPIRIVDNNPPECSFTYSPEKPSIGDEVTFKATASDVDGDKIVGYRWDFGAENRYNGLWLSNANEKTITYDEAGNFTITLHVEDDKGLRSQQSSARIQVYETGQGSKDKGGGSAWWLWMIVALMGAGVVVLVFMLIGKKSVEEKKEDEDEFVVEEYGPDDIRVFDDPD